MKPYKVLLLPLIVCAVLSVPAQAGNRRGNSGSQVTSTPARSSASSFRSSPGFHSGGGRMIAPSQRFSSMGTRSMPTSFRQRSINSSGSPAVSQRRFTPGTFTANNGLARFQNNQRLRTTQSERFAQIQNNRANRLAQIQNHPGDRLGQFENRRARNLGGGQNTPGNHAGSVGNANNRGNQARLNGNRHPGVGDGRNHVFAQRDGNWHRDWDRHCDHWWNGHRCRWVNNSWFIFDIGFFPWYGYPYDYYASDYYINPYVYDSGVYEGDSSYYSQGTYDSDQSDSTVAAAQEQLARQGYYRGAIDGVFGPETQRATMRYQGDHGLRVTGYLTMDTLQSLGVQRVASY